MLIAGAGLGELDIVADAAALLSERDPFLRTERNRLTRHVSQSDLWDRLDHLREHWRTGREEFELGTIHREGARRIERVAEQLRSLTPVAREAKRGARGAAEVTLARTVLAGFPDRVARRRRLGAPEALLATGRGVQLSETSAVREAEYFVALDVDGAREPALVRIASAIDRDWLTGPGLQTRTMVEFDAATGRVQARQRTTWGAIVLTDTPAPLPETDEVAAVLAAAARQAWDRVYPPDDPAVPRWIARVESLRSWFPELELPDFSEPALQARLERLSRGCRSLTELRQTGWIEVLRDELSPPQLAALERETPERIQVPSGSRIAIEYTAGGPPILPVRIQEVFGWQATPRIAGGRIKLVLHLLAPNHRPQQITDDLASFWANGYPIVRGELRRRYPKHAWPDDPRTATPERRPTKK
jgi:ATP-dependent helicase HrpB